MENNLRSIIAKKVVPRGAYPTKITHTLLRTKTFDDEIKNIQILSHLNIPLQITCPTLFYPGCGSDLIFPLQYVQTIWPDLKTIHSIFVDIYGMQTLIETELSELNIPFAKEENILIFYWNNLLVRLEIITANIFTTLNQITQFDIYFERAFRIMKSAHDEYESIIISKLNHSGILISDSGFTQYTRNQKSPLEEIPLSEHTQNTTCDFQKLSAYQEMIIAIKK